jgi:hypothetical protein
VSDEEAATGRQLPAPLRDFVAAATLERPRSA